MIGNAGGFLPLLDHLRQLEAIHARHLDIEDQQREILGDKGEQRFVGGVGADQPVAGIIQHSFQRGQVLRLVIHEQDVDRARSAQAPA